MVLPQVSPQPVPGLKQNAMQIIASALRLIHVLAPGESPTTDEAQDSLAVLNQMFDAWNADRLTIYTIAITDFPLTPSKSVYSLGAGGDFDFARPAKITRASIVLLYNAVQPLERPLKIYVNEKEWQEVSIKAIPSTFPLAMYDDGAFPFRNLTFWPIPLENHNFRLYSWGPLNQFPDLTTPYQFPPGYAEAIRYNLSLRLVDEFSGELGPTLVQGAVQSLAKIKIMNTPLTKLACDEAMVGDADPGITNYRSELFNIA